MNAALALTIATELDKAAKLSRADRTRRKLKLRVVGAGLGGQLVGSAAGVGLGALSGNPAPMVVGSIIGGAVGRALATYFAYGKANL